MKIVTVHVADDSHFPVQLGRCILNMKCMDVQRSWWGEIVKTETVAENMDAHTWLSETGGIFE